MKKLTAIIVVALLVVCTVAQYYIYTHRRVAESIETHIKHDTVFVREPVAVNDTIISYISIPMTLHDTIVAVETDTIRINGDTLQLPITQKEYRDTNYVAYVSGFRPKLDSIAVINRTITNTIIRTEKVKRSRWNIGITAGYGYGIQYGHFEPFVGVGVTYNILR